MYTSPLDCPAEMLNPFTLRSSKQGLLDAANDVARTSEKMKIQFKETLMRITPRLRAGLGADDEPEVSDMLTKAVDRLRGDTLKLYCSIQRQNRIAQAGIGGATSKRTPLCMALK